ncbi:hypothetical protein NPIL_238161 [Nephila pilipes]|uniref:Uncharacterized protein n=1 Tax=Nephila pilipes TaxID=299642 RepID=A0A8X6UAI2_NEPPI|nr:hypothetical protein NPIL_238161 [Nephila pilipes]
MYDPTHFQQRFCDLPDIRNIKSFIRFFRDAYESDSLFMDVNDYPHGANFIKKFPEREAIERILGVVKSPNLNPIKNLEDYFRKAVTP